METLYHQTNKLIQEGQGDLARYERATGMSHCLLKIDGWGTTEASQMFIPIIGSAENFTGYCNGPEN